MIILKEQKGKWKGIYVTDIMKINIYYLCVFIACIILIYYYNNGVLDKNNKIIEVLILSSSCCVMGSIVSYSQKTYHILIEMEYPNNNMVCNCKRVGIILYLIWKPLYSITYSVVIVFSIIIFISGFSISYNIINFQVYFIEIISYFIGYNNGLYLDSLKNKFLEKTNILGG